MGLEFGEQLVVVPRRIADHYLTEGRSESPKNVYFEPDTFNVRNYASLRLEYKVALADVTPKDTAAGIEVGNYLQSLVDAVSLTQDSALGITQARPIFSSPTRLVNPFKLQTETRQAHMARKEFERDEMLRKRKEELKVLLSNQELVKSSRENRQALLNRSMQYDSGIKESLRTKEYLEELKRKSMEIKKLKTEAATVADNDTKKINEAVFFMKKKKAHEFVEKKTVEYSQRFQEAIQKKEKDQEFMRMKTMQEEKLRPLQKKTIKETHQSALEEHKKAQKHYESIYASLKTQLEGPGNKRPVVTAFEGLKHQTEARVILDQPDIAHKVANKLVMKLLVDRGVAPKVVSLKRLTELMGRSAKKQANPHYMSLEEFEALLLEVAIDSSVPSKPDPIFTRSRQDLARSSQLRASSVHSAVRDFKIIPQTEVVSKVVTRQGTATPMRGGLEDGENLSSVMVSAAKSPKAGTNYQQKFDLGRAEMNLREITTMLDGNSSEF